MKNYALQPGFILLALAVIAGTLYLATLSLTLIPNASYKFVLFFIVVIVASNIVAKIINAYINH